MGSYAFNFARLKCFFHVQHLLFLIQKPCYIIICYFKFSVNKIMLTLKIDFFWFLSTFTFWLKFNEKSPFSVFPKVVGKMVFNRCGKEKLTAKNGLYFSTFCVKIPMRFFGFSTFFVENLIVQY